MDVSLLRTAHEDFLTVAAGGGFAAPPAGEWDAEWLLAHVAAADAAIASVALAAAGGQRSSYDNRARELGDLVAGIGRFHLPLHAQQLAGLRS
jgi:hypothetical protein